MLGRLVKREINYMRVKPTNLLLFFTYRCTSQCKSCTMWQRSITEPELTLEEWKKFIDMVEWLFISKNSYSITHMRVNEKVYEILTSQKDPMGGDKVYLVPDVLYRFSFDVFDENDIERFYNGLLKLDAKKISEGLFKMAKKSISKADKIKMYSAGNESSPLDIFRKVVYSNYF